MRCQEDKTFLEADVLAYAETLKAPVSQEKKDKVARLREELDAHKHALLRIFKAIPDLKALEKAVTKWLTTSESVDTQLRVAAESAMERLKGGGLYAGKEFSSVTKARSAEIDSNLPRSPKSRTLPPENLSSDVCQNHNANGLFPWAQISPVSEPYIMHIIRLLEQRAKRNNGNDELPPHARGQKRGECVIEFMHALKKVSLSGVSDALIRMPKIPGLFDDVSEIDWSAVFCFTGIFAFGERHDCEDQARRMGGTVVRRPIKGMPCYVVVGSVASPGWANSLIGRKIEHAIFYREDGAPVKIISEDTWMKLLLCN